MHLFDTAASQLLDRDIRLAFFDIDGTLLGLDGNYTQRLKTAIAAARRFGIKTAIASGRPKFAADFLINELNLTDAGVFYTGGLVYDPSSDTVLAQHPLPDQLVEKLLQAAKILNLYTEVCTADHFYVEQQTDIGLCHSEHLRVSPSQCDLHSLIGVQPIIKLLFAVTTRVDHEKLYRLEKEFTQAVFAYARLASQPDWLFASVICTQACKEKAFQQLIDYHGVNAGQVIAFGDAQSDMTFLSMAGIGVAMGNANDQVQAVADLVTLPVWEDGVALVLERLTSR